MSTFTDWNGPQGGVKTADLLAITRAYQDVLNMLNKHVNDSVNSSDVHNVRVYIQDKLQTLEEAINNVYATKEALSEYATDKELEEIVTALSALQTDITSIKQTLNADTFSMPILHATEYFKGKFKITEPIDLVPVDINALAAGLNNGGKCYVLGMLDSDSTVGAGAGTAYLEYIDTNSFSAVVDFAVTPTYNASGIKETYDKAKLGIVTDCRIPDLYFAICIGTNEGKQHAYLTVRCDSWSPAISSIPFKISGVNFITPVDSKYATPVGILQELTNMQYYSIETRLNDIENRLSVVEGINGVGTISFWPIYNEEGIAVNVPQGYHACDGTNINSIYTDLIAKIGTKYPLQSYSIIQVG